VKWRAALGKHESKQGQDWLYEWTREGKRGEAVCQQRRRGRGSLLRAAALHLVTCPTNGPRCGSDSQATSLQGTGPLNSVCPLRGFSSSFLCQTQKALLPHHKAFDQR